MPDNEEACQRGTSVVPLKRPRCFLTKSTLTRHHCFVSCQGLSCFPSAPAAFIITALWRMKNVSCVFIYLSFINSLCTWCCIMPSLTSLRSSNSVGRPDGGAVSMLKCRVQQSEVSAAILRYIPVSGSNWSTLKLKTLRFLIENTCIYSCMIYWTVGWIIDLGCKRGQWNLEWCRAHFYRSKNEFWFSKLELAGWDKTLKGGEYFFF